MCFREKREFPFYLNTDWRTGGREQMYEMWSDYSLTNIANQVMNLLPFALTQHQHHQHHQHHQQNIKTRDTILLSSSLTRYISALLSFHYKGEIFLS